MSLNEIDISKIRSQINKENDKIRHSYEMMKKHSGVDVKKANHWKDVGNKAKDKMNALQDRINAASKKETFTIGKLREIIRELIKQNLEEASTTSNIDGGEGPPKTPFAFSGKRKKDKKKEKEVATNSTGFKVVKESVKRQYRDVYSKYYKTYEAFARELMNLAKRVSKISGDKTDERIILKNFKKHVIPFAGLMNSWSKGRESNPHIDEMVVIK